MDQDQSKISLKQEPTSNPEVPIPLAMASQLAKTLLALPDVQGVAIIIDTGPGPSSTAIEVKTQSLSQFIRLARAMSSSSVNLLTKVLGVFSRGDQEAPKQPRKEMNNDPAQP